MSAIPLPSVVRIGTRESALAMWQANHVCSLLQAAYPSITFNVIGMTTLGDKDQLKPLSEFGNKGVFTKELDTALLANQVDLVVHCLKDLATTLPDGIVMAAAMARGPVDDAIILNAKHVEAYEKAKKDLTAGKNDGLSLALSTLPSGSVVGTSALRRQASIARFHPHLVCKDIRGNVGTRLSKLDAGDYDAIILARVGLERLGLSHRIAESLSSDTYLHAVGQGTLAIVCRDGDEAMRDLAARALDDVNSGARCTAERGMLNALQGGCKVPIAVSTTILECEASAAKEYLAALNEATTKAIGQTRASSESNPSSGSDNKEEEGKGMKVQVGNEMPLPKSASQSTETSTNPTSETLVKLLVARGCVLSVDGLNSIECTSSNIIDLTPHSPSVSYDTRHKTAWDIGVALGESLRSLGAEDILKDIRS